MEDNTVTTPDQPPTRKHHTLSSYTILVIMLLALAVVTLVVAAVPGSGVTGATLGSVIMAPVGGFKDAIQVCIFVLILGGFINTLTATGALDAGIKTLVHRMRGNELALIPILM